MIRDWWRADGINVAVTINFKLDNNIEMTFYAIKSIILIECSHLRII